MPLIASDPINSKSYRRTKANQANTAVPCACTAERHDTDTTIPTPSIAAPASDAISGKIK
jgi:hypothetical protein